MSGALTSRAALFSDILALLLLALQRLCQLALAGALAGCLVERSFPITEFACSAKGPCVDMGPAQGADGGPLDLGGQGEDLGQDLGPPDLGTDLGSLDVPELPDIGPWDSGIMPAACPGLIELPESGVAQGTTAGAPNGYAGACGGGRASDVVHGFISEGPLQSLEISLVGSAYDTVVHVYRDNCSLSNQLGCNDDLDPFILQSKLSLGPQGPGAFAVVVDGFDQEAGAYLLRAEGRIAAGERCDPAKPYLACAFGPCAADRRCPVPLDCPDGVDIDEDNIADEDVCVDPPMVQCFPIEQPAIDLATDFESTVTTGQSIVARRWTLEEAPPGSGARIEQPTALRTAFAPDLAGIYRLRHTVIDALNQAALCELSVEPLVYAQLRIELVWNQALSRSENDTQLELQLLHPSATAWFDEGLSCSSFECFELDWGANGFQNDPYSVRYTVPLAIELPQPEQNRTYSVGVAYEYAGSAGLLDATARIVCNGVLERSIPLQGLMNGEDPGGLGNDFIKVADLSFSGGSCMIQERLQVVTIEQAMSAR